MPTARESLLDAALSALAGLPWPAVRMVDVAAVAGVSRQTLYNEFGSKEGLARALVRREADVYLRGVDRALALRSAPAERLVDVAEWTLGAARSSALVRALLTGAWSARLPAPSVRTGAPVSAVPAQRRADAGVPGPAELVAAVRDRALAVLEHEVPGADPVELGRYCETAVRLGLSFVVAPAARAGGHTGQLRAMLAGLPVRATR
ncbi:TetR/AcrR family transcriptional regulator [Streptomyces sp. NBC_00083]|uniref:TetR/AcrR family transcriptional regulator n=1 Tax=Streptomyces sp. NBC_00083 TaxID=2975647 RepID=UPI00224E04E1|nr:TetR/AcrR family transcriptional regulator [Streptomyces sp. NBC_00083]MCX5385546.1 TetR/AcrR family transcriptional regulator [Streptomyces sp. NBC_00083]